MSFTPFEVSQMLDIPDSTLRRLARQFSDHLSPQRARKRRYSERDVETLRFARELLDKGSTVEQVRVELAKIVDVLEDAPPVESTAITPFARQLARMQEQYDDIAAQLAQLRQDRAADRDRIEQLEKQLARPWWKKILRG